MARNYRGWERTRAKHGRSSSFLAILELAKVAQSSSAPSNTLANATIWCSSYQNRVWPCATPSDTATPATSSYTS